MEQLKPHFYLAKYLANLLDNQIRIGKFSVGLDPVIGLIPIWGDMLTLGLSFYIIWIAVQLRLPAEKVAQMIGNSVFDFLVGLIPVLGDLTDFFYKSNLKNIAILEEYFQEELKEAKVV